MFRRGQVAWKLSGLFSAIIAVVLIGNTYINSRDDRKQALVAAQDVSRLQSETVIQSLRRFMARGDCEGTKLLIESLSHNNPVYDDIQLISHEGKVVASFHPSTHQTFSQDAWPCSECHITGEPLPALKARIDRVSLQDNGERILSIVLPIENGQTCRAAGCHAGLEAHRPVGYLKADYSLTGIDQLVEQHSRKTMMVLIIAILLCAVASWYAVERMVVDRIDWLTTGMKRVTHADLDFRFDVKGSDEFSVLASSFNEMTDQLSSSLTQLRRTREYLEGIVESSADIIITVDPDGLIRKFNTGAERILGYSRDDVIGKRVEMLFANPSERDTAIAQLEYSDHVVNYETHFLTKDGKVRDVILTLSRLRRRDGTPLGTFGISKDVTREKRLQRQLLQSEKMAVLGQAITGIQHSIKNLLNNLKGGSYMVKMGLGKDDKTLLAEGWAMVEDGISHMTRLSSSMLKYAREQKLTLREVDLGEMVTRIQGLMAPRFKEKGVLMELEVSSETPAVRCDDELIHTVLIDLVTNALETCVLKDYPGEAKPKVRIVVGLGDPADFVRVEVIDNGEGMSEEVRQKMFLPFFSTKKQRGTGMGLAVASRVVSSHGGKISVESELGVGTKFQVLLPMNGPGQAEEKNDV